MTPPEPALERFLVRHALADVGAQQHWDPLTGGVSSEIWRVEVAGRRPVCVKRALAKLKVKSDWYAPVSRNAHEWAWMQFAARVSPEAVPAPLAHDADAGLFAMSYLAPDEHPVWKQQLLDGRVEPSTARAVGKVLGTIHSASAGRQDLQRSFDTTASFFALRLEPYLLQTASVHPSIALRLQRLADATAQQRLALVHGDVSPKNILVGPSGPVLLDAECAWYGDPAFDLAFCLNHLLLKCVHRPDRVDALRESFAAMVDSYCTAARFEPRSELEARAAALLPALLLARIDGKSPVEYITDDHDKERIRSAALPLLEAPVARLEAVAERCYPLLCTAR